MLRSIVQWFENMKAIRVAEFAANPEFVPVTVPTPSPSPDQYLIKITHCSPQHVDILHAQGRHQDCHPKKGWCHPPFILGYEFGGVVVKVPQDGSGKKLKAADRVFGTVLGSFAEYVCAKDSDAIRRVPDGLTIETCTAMSGQTVSYAATVDVAKVKEDEIVLVRFCSVPISTTILMIDVLRRSAEQAADWEVFAVPWRRS